MKQRILQLVAVLLIGILLSACGPTQAEKDATATQQAVYNFATQMAKAPTATATLTPIPTDTPTPTLTPTPLPTDTPTPTLTPSFLPGWKRFEAQGIEIWFPESYTGGDLANDLDIVVQNLKTLGPEFERIARTIEANPNLFTLWVFDSEIGETGFLTNVNIGQEKVLSVITLETYMNALAQQLPSSFVIVEQEIVQLEKYEAGRLVIEADISGVLAKELIYLIKDKSTMWVVTYATGLAEFATRLEAWEQSAQTFRLMP